MERAVFITKISNLKYVNDKYTRIYFGNEFCERLIPSILDIKMMLSYISNKGLFFSFVTPFVTDKGLNRIEMLLKFLNKEKVHCEVVINDWGVFYLINQKYPEFTPVLGRLLTKQKRCPILINLLKREKKMMRFQKDASNNHYIIFQKILPLDLDPYYKGSNVSSVPIIHNFLSRQSVRRIELDNTIHGLFLELPTDKIAVSIYHPYVYISTTFFCPTADCDQEKKSSWKIKPCNKQCQRYVFKLRHKTMPKAIFLRGNTKFYKNSKLSIKELESKHIDRLVYSPEIPL